MFFVLFASILLATALAHPTGAPTEACDSMTPDHGVNPESTQLPNTISLDKTDLKAKDKLKILIEGPPFRGFLAEVRKQGSDEAVGKFIADEGQHTINCHNNKDVSMFNYEKLFYLYIICRVQLRSPDESLKTKLL